ncbi:MAG: aminoacyl-tRNA hydrolase [Microthrixaceae bacterium]
MGNPGSRYAHTLHNVGFAAVALLARRHGVSLKHRSRDHALVAEVREPSRRWVLAQPQTFMNESGRAVVPLMRHHGIDDGERLVVVHDELDLEPGRIKLKRGGGLAGNNGLRSISSHLHTQDFLRIRIGVGKPPRGAAHGADHVLSVPRASERELIGVCVEEAADAVELILSDGFDAAMARYNQR